MQEEKISYRQIMKATSLFGGVQIISIFISILRSKFVAIFLGPAGMGVVGLLQSAIDLIAGITSFGLGTSAVKDIAEAVGSNNSERIGIVVKVVRRLVWFTGLIGAFLTIVFSSQLSQLTFGNTEYTYAFIWLSITLLLNQLSLGQSVLLQGFRELKLMAKSSLLGSFLSLFITIPVYYQFGEKGIVPVIILTSASTLLLTWYFSRKLKVKNIELNTADTIAEGKSMMVMGFMISLSSLLTIISSYVIRMYVNNTGSIDDVGLYSAGFVIINTYVGLIFTAMGTDYYPRLAQVNQDNSKLRILVSQQAIVALLIIVPLIVLFLIFSPIAIQLLYSKQFLPIEGMVTWGILGMFFKAVSWSLGFVLFAKNDSKLFIWTAIGFNAVFLLNNLLGYYIWGLTGLGITFLVNYAIHFFVLFFITSKRYQFYFDSYFYKIFLYSLIVSTFGFLCTLIDQPLYRYLVGFVVAVFTMIFSFIELDKLLNIKELFIQKFKKK